MLYGNPTSKEIEFVGRTGLIPDTLMLKRKNLILNELGFESIPPTELEIREFFQNKKMVVEMDLPLSVQLHQYIETNFPKFLWDGYRENHDHDQVFELIKIITKKGNFAERYPKEISRKNT